MRTLKLVVAYDGTNYHGFQKQKDLPTIQGVLEEKLALLCGEKVVVHPSGRTDAGVHARGQTVSFATEGRIPVENLLRALRGMLPEDIAALSAQEMEPGFHARFSARSKIYEYRIQRTARPDPFRKRYAWQIAEPLDAGKMNEAAAFLLGRHDFGAFRSSGSVDTSPVRTIYEAAWREEGEELVFRIGGDGFLYHMVRNIVWSLVQVGLGRRTAQDFAAELNSHRAEFLNEPAPARGLYLMEVRYE